MKNRLIAALLLVSLFISAAFSQNGRMVRLTLKNNGRVLRHFKFLERHPADPSPNVFTAYIQPGQSHSVEIKVGTRLSLVNQQEIYANMRGQEAPGKPLLTVKAEDDGRTINLITK